MQTCNTDLIRYYAQRAAEYEKVYTKPERAKDRQKLNNELRRVFAGHDVLEVACGTGYWTLPVSEVARSVVGTDVNEEVLLIAQSKPYPDGRVRFVKSDAYSLDDVSGDFTAALASYWFSHIPKNRRLEFIRTLHSKLKPGAIVVFVDNIYVEGSNNPMSDYVDGEGNTYSRRRLQDGSEWDVLKNFPTEDELRKLLDGSAEDIEYYKSSYYWWLSYRVSKFSCAI